MLEETAESELAVFKKRLKLLERFKGRGTELISQYIPANADRSTVMGVLTEEVSQSGNIKSPQTRKAVQGALRKITNFLKQIDFDIPPKGIVVFAGNVSESEGRTDIRLFTVRPPKPLKTKLYWCDSEFHLAPLKEMLAPSEVYGLLTIDKNEATIAVLSGKKYEIIGKFTSGVPGKFRAGGQSAHRFEQLRAEAAKEFYKRISDKINTAFTAYADKLKGIIIGGPGVSKQYFMNVDMIDHRLKPKVLGMLDISYTDESGIRELIQRSEELLRNTDLMKERGLLNKFLEEVARGKLATYGQKEVEALLDVGRVGTLILSEALEWLVHKYVCEKCRTEEFEFVKEPLNYKPVGKKCGKCGQEMELLEEIDYIDYLLEKAQAKGVEVRVVSTDTPEGDQFHKGFGGIAALLRY